MEHIRCSRCGSEVSSPVPDGTLVRAWVECPECVAKNSQHKEKDKPILSTTVHPLTCGGKRHDEAHVAYQAEHGGDLGELISTSKGLMCPVPGCGYKQNWSYEEDGKDVSDAKVKKRLDIWLRSLPKDKAVVLMKEMIDMLEEQEMVGVGTGVPYHYHTGEPLLED